MTLPPGHYVLDGKIVVPARDWLHWDEWLERSWRIPPGQPGSRFVASTWIGPIHISTVFLGLDHAWGGGPPIVFETVIFRGGKGDETYRCSSWQEAEEGHARAVAKVRGEIIEKAQQ